MTIPELTFAFERAAGPDGPWSHLHVVRFDGTEELSALYRYELTLLARVPAPEVDPHDLVGARATLRIETGTEPAYKLLHGVIVEAEEVGPVPEGMLYRVVLMPALVRARHRTRCRIFLEQTTRGIITAVLHERGQEDVARFGRFATRRWRDAPRHPCISSVSRCDVTPRVDPGGRGVRLHMLRKSYGNRTLAKVKDLFL